MQGEKIWLMYIYNLIHPYNICILAYRITSIRTGPDHQAMMPAPESLGSSRYILPFCDTSISVTFEIQFEEQVTYLVLRVHIPQKCVLICSYKLTTYLLKASCIGFLGNEKSLPSRSREPNSQLNGRSTQCEEIASQNRKEPES